MVVKFLKQPKIEQLILLIIFATITFILFLFVIPAKADLIKPNKVTVIEEKLEIQKGELTVLSEPSIAEVYVDEVLKDKIPLAIKDLSIIGEHKIILQLSGKGLYLTDNIPLKDNQVIVKKYQEKDFQNGIAWLTFISTNEQGYKEYKHIKDNSIMVLIPAGEFTMGSNDYSNEKPVHKVYLSAYYIDKYEVTNEQYAKFLNEWRRTTDENSKEMIDLSGSYEHEKCRISKEGGKFVVQLGYEKHPVIYVTWYGANQYAKWAKKRLPTEAEWEKADRASSIGKYCFGNDESKLEEYAWYWRNSYRCTHPVGQKKPNDYMIHDMHGNVWEWCADWYDYKYYSVFAGLQPANNPKGPDTGKYKILRGGSWFGGNQYNLRCADRGGYLPDSGSCGDGFRCVRSAGTQK